MKCQICDNNKLAKILDLPKFPFTGIFVSKPLKDHFADQGLMYCESCGHAQLENFIPYELIYDNTYSHRGSKSSIATSGNDFFYNFLINIIGEKKFRSVVDLGCNDLYLLKKISAVSENLYGIDPIWKDKNGSKVDNINVIGEFIENVDFSKDVCKSADLIISSHTFEHIHEPREQLQKIVENSSDNALFIIEVPSFDTLINNHRFDQVFHQHVNYFSLSSMKKLIDLSGCEYIDHTFNYNFWGGTMLFAFKKNKNRKSSLESFNALPRTISNIKESYKIFKDLLENVVRRIQVSPNRKYFGYGAAQMVPALAYHMNSDLNFLECIFDDNASKDELMYPNLKPKIKHLSEKEELKNKDILVLALDSLRLIIPRLVELCPRKIIIPLDIA